jgi:diguanylate cyclase (GGDEF)-like protein
MEPEDSAVADTPPRLGAVLPVVGVALATAAVSALVLWLWPSAIWALPWVAAIAAAVAWWQRPRPVPVDAQDTAPNPALGEAILRDPSTGMYHRPAFLALAERDWQRAGRYGGAVALLLVEVDRLRSMTEQSGPGVADALLAGLGRQVMSSLRGPDLLARFDDAQLAIFLPQSDPTGALDVAERIREGVQRLKLPGLPEGAAFTASIGVSVLQPLHQPLSALVADAQQSLQAARRAGGNCVRNVPADALASPLRGPSVGGDATRPWRDGAA